MTEAANNKSWPYRVAHKIIGALILLWFAGYLWERRNLFNEAMDASLREVIALVTLILLSWLVVSAQSFILCRQSGSKIGFAESYVLSMAANFGNYLPMRIGTLIRAHYMKSVHHLDFTQFACIFSMRLVLMLMACGLCGFVATVLSTSSSRHSYLLLVFFALMSVVPAALYQWQPANVKTSNALGRFWNRFNDGLVSLKQQPYVSMACLLLVICQLLLLALRFQLAANMLNYALSVSGVMMLVAMSAVASFIAITPGGIGVRESLMGYAAHAIGTTFSLGMLIGSVDRVILLLLTALCGGASFVWIWWSITRRGAVN